ncbi:MAG: GNAT family N-acetyltransferase [Alphaproteobacteria bacterium]
MTRVVPRLETERLLLREWREDDFEWFACISADAEMRRFIGGAQNRVDAWRTFAAMQGHWYLRGHGFWLAERKTDGARLGALGALRHEGWPGLEVGWQLDRRHWGHGYATEGARAAQNWVFENFPVETVISCIDAANISSHRVAGRLGNVKGKPVTLTMNNETFTVDVWELSREQWRKQNRATPTIAGKCELATIPCIETERLILREWREEDILPAIGFMADPEVARYTVGSPQAALDAWRGLNVIVGHWQIRGYGFWAVERKEDGKLVGRAGLWNPEGWPGMEVGWTLGREFWGKGYATEAARAAMNYAFTNFPIEKLLSVIHVDNRRSQMLAGRLGETRGARMEIAYGGKSFPVEAWEITRKRWLEGRCRPS